MTTGRINQVTTLSSDRFPVPMKAKDLQSVARYQGEEISPFP